MKQIARVGERRTLKMSYHEWLESPEGMSFELFPERGNHTWEDVLEVKRFLRRHRDVVRILVTWLPSVAGNEGGGEREGAK